MQTSDLEKKKCVPCEGGVDPLAPEQVTEYLALVEGWRLEDGKIAKDYAFKDFPEALAFINKVGEIAEQEGHHPDIFLHDWNQVKLILYTHAIHGLHLNDFVLAAQINTVRK